MPSFTASWGASSGATGYDVEVAIGPEDFRLVSSNQAAVSYTYAHPPDGSTHQIRVTPRSGSSIGPSATGAATATQDATSTVWRNAVTGLGPNLRAFWPIDDATGTTMTALSGASGTYQAVKTGWMSPVTTDPNRRHRFFDSTGYASVADSPALDLANSFSLVFALRRGTTGTGTYTLYDKGAGSAGVWLVNDKITFGKAGAAAPIVAETGTTADRNPHLVIVTWNGTTAQILKDNVNVTGTGAADTLADTATALFIGRSSAASTGWYSGATEIAAVTGVLTVNQTIDLWNAFSGNAVPYPGPGPTTPPTSPALAYDGGTGLLTASWVAGTNTSGYYVEEQVGPSPVWRRLNPGSPVAGLAYSWAAPPDGTVRRARVVALAPEGTETAPSATASVTVTQGTTSTAFRTAVLALGTQVSYGWTMDEQTTTATMAAVKGTAGVYGAADSTRVPAPGWLSPVPSDRNRSHKYFDGVDDTAQVTDEAGLRLGDGPVTYIVALRRDQSFSDGAVGTRYDTILSRNASDVSLVFKGNKLTLYPAQTTNFIVEESSTTPPDAVPSLFFVTKNGTTATIHKATQTAGLVDVTNTLGSFALTATTNALGVGSAVSPLRNFYSGAMEVYVCPAALTGAQRQTITDAWIGVTAPAPPTSLSAVGSTDGSGTITVSWPRVTGVGAYRVYRNTTGAAPTLADALTPDIADPGAGTTVTYSDTGRTLYTEYFYWVGSVTSGTASTTPTGPARAQASTVQTQLTLFVKPPSLSFAVGEVRSVQITATEAPTTGTLVAFVSDEPITDDMVIADPGAPYTITVAPGAAWLRIDQPSGLTPITVDFTGDPTGLAPGQTYVATATVAVSNALQSPFDIVVSFTVPAVPVVTPPSVPPPVVSGQRLSTWDLVLCDRSGTALGQVLGATGRTFRFPLRGNPTVSFVVPNDHPLVPELTRVGATMVKAYESSTGNRVIRFVGPVTSTERVWETGRGSLACVASGPVWTLERRFVGENTDGATFGTGPGTLDRGELLARMIEALNGVPVANVIAAAGDTGIRRGTITASSSMVVSPPWVFKSAAEALAEVTSGLDSPDWEIEPLEPYRDATGVALGRLNVAPVIGTYAPQAAWEFGFGRSNVASFREVTTADALANRIIVPPPGFPSSNPGLTLAYNDGTVRTERSLIDHGLLEAVVSTSIESWDMRRTLAAQHELVRTSPRRIITVTPVKEDFVDNEGDRRVPRLFADFKVGDFVPFRAVDRLAVPDFFDIGTAYASVPVVDAIMRVFGATVTLDDAGVDSVELQLVADA